VINLSRWKRIKGFCSTVVNKLKLKVVAMVAVVSAVAIAVSCTVAQAALDLTGVVVDTAPVFSMALIVITGLAAIWAIWKTIGLIRAR
jgi:hypothetical protein